MRRPAQVSSCHRDGEQVDGVAPLRGGAGQVVVHGRLEAGADGEERGLPVRRELADLARLLGRLEEAV
jgi:hypothetical protein